MHFQAPLVGKFESRATFGRSGLAQSKQGRLKVRWVGTEPLARGVSRHDSTQFHEHRQSLAQFLERPRVRCFRGSASLSRPPSCHRNPTDPRRVILPRDCASSRRRRASFHASGHASIRSSRDRLSIGAPSWSAGGATHHLITNESSFPAGIHVSFSATLNLKHTSRLSPPVHSSYWVFPVAHITRFRCS